TILASSTPCVSSAWRACSGVMPSRSPTMSNLSSACARPIEKSQTSGARNSSPRQRRTETRSDSTASPLDSFFRECTARIRRRYSPGGASVASIGGPGGTLPRRAPGPVASGDRQRQPVEARGRSREELALLLRAAPGGDALERVPEHRVAAAAEIDREVALEHAARGAEG